MLDGVMRRYNERAAKPANPGFMPENVVTDRKLLNADGRNLHVLFPPWHGGARAYKILSRRLIGLGDAVLQYTFDDHILHEDPNRVNESFRTIKSTVATDLHTIADTHKYERINLIGVSLGTPALTMVASAFSRFDSATLVVPGSRLAPCLWNGIMTQHFRQTYQMQGFNNDTELDTLWKDIAPQRHANAFRGKTVNVRISEHDQVIPTTYQEEFVDALSNVNADVQVQRTQFGHYGTIGAFCLAGSLDLSR
jgi:hypothetical protein